MSVLRAVLLVRVTPKEAGTIQVLLVVSKNRASKSSKWPAPRLMAVDVKS